MGLSSTSPTLTPSGLLLWQWLSDSEIMVIIKNIAIFAWTNLTFAEICISSFHKIRYCSYVIWVRNKARYIRKLFGGS